MKLVRNTLSSLVLIAAVAVTAAAAQLPAAGAPDTAFQMRVTRLVVAHVERRLNLTADQREQARSILKSEQPTLSALSERARQERDELTAMQSFDEQQVRSVAQRYAATTADILVEHAKLRLELRAILNDGQRKQLDTLRARFGNHFDDRLNGLIDAI